MFSYEMGVLVAFLFFLYGTVNMLVHINSRMEKNLKKVGMRLSWLSLAPKEMTSATDNPPLWKNVFKFIAVTVFGLALVLLSWLQVALFLGGMIYRRSKDADAPEYIREYRWKLRNVDMSFNGMAREMFKVAEAQGSLQAAPDTDKEAVFQNFREIIVHDMLERGLLVQLMRIRPDIQDMTVGAREAAGED